MLWCASPPHKHAQTPHTDTVLTSLHNSPDCLGCTLTSMLFSSSLHLFLFMKGVPLSGSRAHSPAASNGARLGRGQTILFSPGLRGHLNMWINQCVCASAKTRACLPFILVETSTVTEFTPCLPRALPCARKERGSHPHVCVFSPHTCRTASEMQRLHVRGTCVPGFLPVCLLPGQSIQ